MADLDRYSQLVGQAQALVDAARAMTRCIDDGSGIDGLTRWFRLAEEELESEAALLRLERRA